MLRDHLKTVKDQVQDLRTDLLFHPALDNLDEFPETEQHVILAFTALQQAEANLALCLHKIGKGE